MPTYEYKCTNCNHQFETFQSINASSLTKCPKCGKDELVRLISGGGGIIFKGTGFYCTDYKSTPHADPEKNYSTGASSKKMGNKKASA